MTKSGLGPAQSRRNADDDHAADGADGPYVAVGVDRPDLLIDVDVRNIAAVERPTRTQPSAPPVRMHGVGDLGIPRKVIAETIAGKLGVEAKSITKEEAPQYLGFLASFVGLDNPTSNDKTRRVLGWEPAHTGWVQDVQTGYYIT